MDKTEAGISLVVQQFRLHTSTAGGLGFLPGQETKIPKAIWYGKKIKQTHNRNRLTDIEIGFMVAKWGTGQERDGPEIWDWQIQTITFRMDKYPTVQHRELHPVSWDKP